MAVKEISIGGEARRKEEGSERIFFCCAGNGEAEEDTAPRARPPSSKKRRAADGSRRPDAARGRHTRACSCSPVREANGLQFFPVQGLGCEEVCNRWSLLQLCSLV